jgi:hypothetical protein
MNKKSELSILCCSYLLGIVVFYLPSKLYDRKINIFDLFKFNASTYNYVIATILAIGVICVIYDSEFEDEFYKGFGGVIIVKLASLLVLMLLLVLF